MKRRQFILISFFGFLSFVNYYAQNCGLKNPSFEYYSSCPSGFSQYEKVDNWVNILPDLKSEPDYFNESCPNGSFGNFNYTGFSDVDGTVFNPTAQHLCGRIGMYLNKDSGDDARIKEYITQRVDLKSGVTYQIRIQVEKSSFVGSSTLQRDLTFFGYNGSIPTTEVNLCPVGIDSLTAISKNAITTANQTFTVTFTASQNYDYLVLGANCNEILYATATGYIFIDKIELTSTSNTSAFTPIISHVSNDSNFIPPVTYDSSYSNQCKNCFSDYRNKMVLEGNKIPAGITATWGQKASNPESVTFTNPNDSITSLTGTTKLTPGFYMFYYQFSNGTCTMIDSLEVNVRAPLLFTAGPDILNCSGNNDYSYFNSTRSLRYASYPNNLFADANSWNFMELQKPDITGSFKKYYWSMIQKDTTDFVFMNTAGIPHTGNGLCQGSLNARAWIPPFNYIPLRMQIDLQNPQDSIYLVLTVFDECNTQSSDTLLIINNDINLRWDKPAYCIGDTALIYQDVLNQTTCFVTNKLNQKPNLTFTWNIDDTLLSPINLNVTDSLRLVINPGARLGWHKIRLTIFDSITNCSFYDEHSFYVKDSVREFLAGKDIIFCGGNNDDLYDTSIYNYYNAPYQNTRAVGMNARPIIDTINANDYTTWWSMIRENGTEWTFPNPCGIPFDGADEGDVATIFYTTDSTNCGDINKSTIERYWAHSPFARFQIKNARDTVKFIWHLLDICGNDTIEYKDTMVVYMNDLDLPPIVTFHCITDTVIVSQIINSHYRQLVPDSNLIYRWSGPSDIYFVDSTVNDSVKIYFDSNTVRSVKYLRFTVTDTATGCSWFDQTRIDLRIELDSINAGDDIILCNSNFVGQKVKMNAYPDYFSINPNLYSTYWSVVQPSGPDYVFANPCVPFTGTGTDEGLIYTNYSVTSPSYCGSLQTAYFDFSYSNFAEFIFKGYGERKLVWHVIDKCDSTIHLTDTITIKWDFNEPVVSAGPDQNPNCDGAFLTGSPSASSSGTSGCFKWKQISGPDTLELIDSTKRVAQLINLDSVSPGIYQFEYTLGCDFCASTDTMTVTIDSISKPPFQMTWDTTSKICIEDSMIFYGKGGSTYAWFVNDSLIKPYSTDSVFSVASSLDTIKVSVLIKDSVNECISFRQNFFHKFVGRVCYADRDTIYSCGDVCVSTQDLPYGNHSFISCDSLTTKMGATYTLSDTCITYKPVTAPQTWFYDTLCVVLIDTINDIYDTTDVFITNCDSSLFLSCKDDTLYLDNLGNVITIDTSYVVDSIFASTGIDSVYLSNNSFDCSSIGQNSVTVTARNSNFLKIRNCIATVTILDTIKPIVYCHDTTLCLNSNGKVFFDTAAVLTDIIENCTLDSVWINKDSAICNQDSVAVKIYARDQSGNIGECYTFIYVKDTIKPIVYCHDTTLYLNAIGKVFFDTSAVLNSIDENCTIDSVWMNKDSATCMNDTVYTTIFARDNSGNIGQCEAIIFILDTIKPIVFCHDTTLYLNSNGKVYFDTSAVFSSVLENCTVDSIWMDKDSANCSQDSVWVTIYALDNSNNIGQCTSIIYIEDTIKPQAICRDTTLYIQPNGWAVIDTNRINNSSFDNCNPVNIQITKDSFNCADVGINSVYLIITDRNGNKDSCTSTITVIDTNTAFVNAGPNTSYCHASSITMNGNLATGRSIGTWLLDTNFANANTPTINSIHQHNTTISNLIEGEYQFIWNVKNSPCYDLFDTVLVKIYSQPIASLPPDIDLCYENTISIKVAPLTGLAQGFWTNYYNSSNIPGTNYFNDSAIISTILQGGEYQFYFEARNGVCPASRDSIKITRHYIPNTNFTIDTNFVCENGCVTFSNTSTINPPETIVDYEWIVDAFTRKSTGFTICFSETGQKDVRLIATSNFGCKDTIYRPNHITVHPNPIAGFSCNENENINTYIHFIDQSTNAQYYHYSFGDGQSSTFPNPNHNYKNLGNYTVTQIVVDSVGCKDTILKPIEIRDLSIYVPNSFTPNSDGINDVFVPVILGGDTSQIEFLIFNRWGELIFKSESELKGWDGFHQGVLCQQGSYIWKIKVKQQDRFEVKEYTGHVILLR